MHHVGGSLPLETVPDGTTLLVLGPPMTGKRALLYRVLADSDDGSGVTGLVTTDVDGATTVEEFVRSGGDADPDRLGVVDATSTDQPGDERVRPVDAPTDPGTVGVALTELLADLSERQGGTGRNRVGVASLSTLATHASAQRVVGFLHVLTTAVEDGDGLGIVLAHSDTLESALRNQLTTLVDGVVEVRDAGDGSECRVSGVTETTTGWTAIEGAPPPVAPDTATDTDGGDGQSWPRADDHDRVESLSALIESVETDRPTLTLLNYDGPGPTLTSLEQQLDALNVAVRTDETGLGQPRNVALLHREDDLLASTTVSELESTLTAVEEGVDAFERAMESSLVSKLNAGDTYGARGVDKGYMTELSHAIEMRAWRTGTGTLHTGFQRLSRLVDHTHICRIYERLGASGVDVHVYGFDDAEVTIPDVTVHASRSEELLESWFVVFDGGHLRRANGRPNAGPRHAGTLVAEERAPEEYYGFWTYRPEMAHRVGRYLAETYPARDADHHPGSART